jgi:hypothetical protein
VSLHHYVHTNLVWHIQVSTPIYKYVSTYIRTQRHHGIYMYILESTLQVRHNVVSLFYYFTFWNVIKVARFPIYLFLLFTVYTYTHTHTRAHAHIHSCVVYLWSISQIHHLTHNKYMYWFCIWTMIYYHNAHTTVYVRLSPPELCIDIYSRVPDYWCLNLKTIMSCTRKGHGSVFVYTR